MKKELFLTLSFIAITPQMTKTGNDYPYAGVVGAIAIACVSYGLYSWCHKPQEQQNPNNNNVPTENPQKNPENPNLANFQIDPDKPLVDLSIQTNQEKPTIDDLINSQKDKEQPFLNNNTPIENPQIDQKKPTLTNFTKPQDFPINDFPEPRNRNELPSQQNLPQPKKISAIQINTQNLEKILRNDKNYKKVLNQLLEGQFD